MQTYVHGLSARGVDELIRALGVDTGIPESKVFHICADLEAEVEEFRTRTHVHTQFRYVFAAATFCKGAHMACATAVSVTAPVRRLVATVGTGEFWSDFLRSLNARGLIGMHLVIFDAHAELMTR